MVLPNIQFLKYLKKIISVILKYFCGFLPDEQAVAVGCYLFN